MVVKKEKLEIPKPQKIAIPDPTVEISCDFLPPYFGKIKAGERGVILAELTEFKHYVVDLGLDIEGAGNSRKIVMVPFACLKQLKEQTLI